MSRLNSDTPETSSLPRRRFLQVMTAAPVALTTATTAFSPPSSMIDAATLKAAVDADPRFAEFDRLASEIIALDLREEAAFEGYDEETITRCTEESEENGPSPWVVLHNSLIDDMQEFAKANSASPTNFLDLILQMKIADYYFAVGDKGFDEVNEACPAATRHGLEFWGVRPQIPIEELRKDAPAHVALHEEYAARKPQTPYGVNVGNLIIQTRRIGKAANAALRREASLEDGTPESDRAIAITDRWFDELESLRDKVIAGVNRSSAERGEDDPYSLSQTHLFAVWIELIEALCPDFLDGSAQGSVGPILLQLRNEARSWATTFIEQAMLWNSEQGVSNA